MYDSATGRFLSPNPYVQAPDFYQNFNRYTYVMNNPLRYVDENGEFIHIIIGTLTGGVGNGTVAALKGNNFWTGKDVQFGRGSFSFNNTPTRPAPEMKMLEAPKISLDVNQSKVSASIEQLEISERPFAVTDKGVVLPKDPKYEIPGNFIDNPNAKIPN